MKQTKIELESESGLICSTCLFASIHYDYFEDTIYCNYYKKEMKAKCFESFLEATNVNKLTKKGDFCKVKNIIVEEED